MILEEEQANQLLQETHRALGVCLNVMQIRDHREEGSIHLSHEATLALWRRAQEKGLQTLRKVSNILEATEDSEDPGAVGATEPRLTEKTFSSAEDPVPIRYRLLRVRGEYSSEVIL